MSRWHLLVVEDESIVRLGLRHMVDWSSFGIEWASEASNAEEAMRTLEAGAADIVMTDIRMPGTDGLEFASQLKRMYPRIQIIFMSSYDNFQYAKEAIRIGAVDYLHKPTMDEREISNALRKAIAALEERHDGDESATEAGQNEYFLSLLDEYTYPGPNHVPKYSLADIAKAGFWLAAFRKRDDGAKGGSADFDELRFYSILHAIKDIAGKERQGVVFHRSMREILWIVPASVAGDSPAEKAKCLNDMRQIVLELLNTALVYSFSSTHADVRKLPVAYLETLLQLPADRQTDNHIVRQAKKFVDRNLLDEDLSLSQVAKALQISPGYLSRVFLKEVGENFSDYIIRNKIEYAQGLLRGTNKKIYEISSEIGYANAHYFSKLFKARTGVTPLEYRNQ